MKCIPHLLVVFHFPLFLTVKWRNIIFVQFCSSIWLKDFFSSNIQVDIFDYCFWRVTFQKRFSLQSSSVFFLDNDFSPCHTAHHYWHMMTLWHMTTVLLHHYPIIPSFKFNLYQPQKLINTNHRKSIGKRMHMAFFKI